MYPPTRTGFSPVDYYELLTGATATEGFIAVMDAAGKVKDGADEADIFVVGLIKAFTTLGKVEVEAKPCRLLNSEISTLARADRGSVCYLEDGETVRKTAGSHSVVCGLVIDVDSEGVWVDLTPQGLASARAVIVNSFTQMAVESDPSLGANDLTDSTSGTPSATHALETIGDTTSVDQSTVLKNNFATMATEFNGLKDDVEAVQATIASLIDKLQGGSFMAS